MRWSPRCSRRLRACLRISVATDFGVNLLSPILGDFLLEYPDITVNMVLNNRYVELISEGFDMAIRVGELEDSPRCAPAS
jgi:DNA-binding transcriptional LysR family regulator